MANIKFSQFTVGNTESDIDFVVGYKGANNIQISPANLLSATLAGYLPLTGGTMNGNVVFSDGRYAYFGGASDLGIVHSGADSLIVNETGDLYIRNKANDKDIIFQSDDGSGGITEYFRVDGGNENIAFSKNITFPDNVQAQFGSALDLRLVHTGSDSYIQQTGFGDLIIQQTVDDTDISFQCDNGSGGVAEYFRLDGGLATGGTVYTVFPDNSRATFGNGYDLQIYHDASNSYIKQGAGGHLIIQQETDDGDIAFKSDDGSGGVATYMTIDGGITMTTFAKDTRHNDNVKAAFGDSADLQIYHDGTNSRIYNETGDLYIRNNADDKDIYFQSDNGSGGVATYLQLDGSATNMKVSKDMRFLANVDAEFGTGGDFKIYHDGSNQYLDMINSGAGNIVIQNQNDDADIIFKSDNGSGGITTYFFLDGNIATGTYVYTVFPDNSRLSLGSGTDLRLWHSGTQSYIQNYTGQLNISANGTDDDIIFYADDGAGGITEYFRVDGGTERIESSKSFRFADDVRVQLGSSSDLQIYHNSATGNGIIENGTGHLVIQNNLDDSDIVFRSDDGSGGVTDYFRLDGSDGNVKVYKQFGFLDNVKATFGNSGDLEVYHSGSHSFINGSNGAGSLYLRPGAGGTIQLETPSGVDMISTNATDVRMYSSGNERLRVKNIGINIQNVPTYADNTAAIAGGLTTGDVYRTGDLLKIVH